MGACTSKKPYVNRSLMGFKISMTAYIWSKNAHNLFDFESKQFTKKEIEIDFPARLATIENELIALTKSEMVRNQVDLLDISLENNNQAKLSTITNKQDNRIWAIIKNKNSDQTFNSFEFTQFWDLKLNDIIKLGRIRLQLIDFAFMKEEQEEIQTELEKDGKEEQENEPESCSKEYQEAESTMCRICFSRKATSENPLISPCLCTGSVKYIHVSCLQSWIGVQLKIKKGDNFIQYTWKKMQCEICKNTFKSSYQFQGKNYNIMNIPKPRSSFLTLRVTSDDKCKEGMIYVIEFRDKKELKIGRVPECDVKLKDISVSRQHAILKLIPVDDFDQENPKYHLRLQDINSKFGTLILAQWDELLQIKEREFPILYQVGRVLISFNIKSKGKKQNASCYKHPEGLQIQNFIQVPINELATNFNQQQNNGSFQTHNELNVSEIVIREQANPLGQSIANIQNQNGTQFNLRHSLSQPINPQQQQNNEIQQIPQLDNDLSVCDERR